MEVLLKLFEKVKPPKPENEETDEVENSSVSPGA
jgi:hypothetical protein